jgi:hypothetical protein
MSLWYCSDCAIAFGPQPHCPRCGKPGIWQRIIADAQESPADQDDPDDPDIDVPEGTEIDVPEEVLAEFEAELDAYEKELRDQLGQQFAGYEDIDHPDEDIDHPDDSR